MNISKTSVDLTLQEISTVCVGDSSDNIAWYTDRWSDLPENAGSTDGPRYLVAHYIKHIQPDARIIFIMRNPSLR